MISVVIPTIAGREEMFDRTVAAYRETSNCEIIVVRNRPTCGQAWNAGAQKATGQYLHLAADDVLPHDGWAEAAIAASKSRVYPAPLLTRPDGSVESCGSMGGGMLLAKCDTGTPCNSSPFPFVRRDLWTKVGPALPIHYYGDDFLSWQARRAGLSCEVVTGYHLTHLEGTAGRQRVAARAMQDKDTYLAAIAKRS